MTVEAVLPRDPEAADEDRAIETVRDLVSAPRPELGSWRTALVHALGDLGFEPAGSCVPEKPIATTEDLLVALGDLIEDERFPGIWGLDDEQEIEEGAKGPRRISLLLSGDAVRLDVSIVTVKLCVCDVPDYRKDETCSETERFRAIIGRYAEAVIDALGQAACQRGPKARPLALQRAVDVLSMSWGNALAGPFDVRRMLAMNVEVFGTAPRRGLGSQRSETEPDAWLARVQADVLARLDGDTTRPLPESADLPGEGA